MTQVEQEYSDKKKLNRLAIRERTVMLKKLRTMLQGEILENMALDLDPTHGPFLGIGEIFRVLCSETERTYILEINTRNRKTPNWIPIGNQGEFTLHAFLIKSVASHYYTPINTILPTDLAGVDLEFFNRIKND